jgi:hypothetical protein
VLTEAVGYSLGEAGIVWVRNSGRQIADQRLVARRLSPCEAHHGLLRSGPKSAVATVWHGYGMDRSTRQ